MESDATWTKKRNLPDGSGCNGFDDENASKVLRTMIDKLRPGAGSKWSMIDQFHLVVSQWIDDLRLADGKKYLAKHIDSKLLVDAAQRKRELRRKDAIPDVMNLVSNARANPDEFRRVATFVGKVTTSEGRQSLIESHGGVMCSQPQDQVEDDEDDDILPNNSTVVIIGLKNRIAQACNHLRGTIKTYNTITCRHEPRETEPNAYPYILVCKHRYPPRHVTSSCHAGMLSSWSDTWTAWKALSTCCVTT